MSSECAGRSSSSSSAPDRHTCDGSRRSSISRMISDMSHVTGSDESTRQNAALAAVEAGSDIVKHKGTAAQAAKAAALAAASKGGNARVVMKAAYASATTAVIVNGGTAEEAGKAAVDAVLAAGGEASNAQEAFLSAFRAARKAGLPRGGNVSILCMPLLTEPIVAFSSRA